MLFLLIIDPENLQFWVEFKFQHIKCANLGLDSHPGLAGKMIIERTIVDFDIKVGDIKFLAYRNKKLLLVIIRLRRIKIDNPLLFPLVKRDFLLCKWRIDVGINSGLLTLKFYHNLIALGKK